MIKIDNIEAWKENLGMLPVYLHHKAFNTNKFILLNGGANDFCLDLKNEEDINSYFSQAWSSNTKNFISVLDDYVSVYNWKLRSSEKISIKTVERNFDKFYDYLATNSFRTELDIVPFILNIYRKIRNFANESPNGNESLNLLFLIFAATEDRMAFNEIDLKKWGIKSIDLPIQGLDQYLDEFSKGLLGTLKPSIELILRHTSGSLFQEAHQEAYLFDKSLDLFSGTLSGNYKSKSSKYSSVHFTPSYIARSIVEQSLRQINFNETTSLKILDPACGTSEFLMEALKQLKAIGYRGTINIQGYDVSQSAIDTSNFLLTYEKREWDNKLSFNFTLVDDSLKQNWDDFDILLMNPPYNSWENIAEQRFKNSIKETLGSLFEKRPNQASAFLYKAINSLKADGVIGCVLPTSIFTIDSYSKLRSFLQDNTTTILIGKLGNFVFENALTDVSIYVGKKEKQNVQKPTVLWTTNEKGIAHKALRSLRKSYYLNIPITNQNDFTIHEPSIFPINKLSWKIVSYRDEELLKKIELNKAQNILTNLENIFKIYQGALTGNNKLFKISREFYLTLNERERFYFKPTIDKDAISSGKLSEHSFLWYPYDENGILINSENELSQKVPKYYTEVLLPNKESLSKREKISLWWELTRPRTWQFKNQNKICSTRFGNNNSYAFDDSGKFIVENGCALILKEKQNTDVYYFYLAFFNSLLYQKLLSIYSKQLAGGKWYDLGGKYTRIIPIPKINNFISNTDDFKKLVSIGKDIWQGHFFEFRLIDSYLYKYFYPQQFQY